MTVPTARRAVIIGVPLLRRPDRVRVASAATVAGHPGLGSGRAGQAAPAAGAATAA
ncbi:hypothetical protein [Leifsonia sp. NPDC058248]|uniref:hypothetical protein n=1 Tax=Leifsonia sp. NPDC058248 TaxID=3346402 RepID=UPI0036DF0C96